MTSHNPFISYQIRANILRLGSLWLAVCILLFVSGCGKSEPEESKSNNDSNVTTTSQGSDKPAPSKTDDVTSPKADSGTEMVVKLLDPGAQPRKELRYKFQTNRTETMVMETTMATTMEMRGQKRPETLMPPTRTTMTLESKELSPEGNIRYEFTLDKAEVIADPNANPMMVNAMKQSLNSIVGLSGWATVTPRGFTIDADMKMPPDIDPQMKQAMANTRQSIKQMSAPLPAEPVGIGAKWQVTMPLETNAMKITQIATYELLEVRGDEVKFAAEIKQSADPQEMNVPGAGPGVKMFLESLSTSGKGTVELRMMDLVPTSNVNLTTINVISANNQQMKTTMKMGMKIHPVN